MNENSLYLVSAIDEYGFSTAPSGIDYIPAFGPISIENVNILEKEFFITIKSVSKAEWLSYEALEYKPDGTNITYEFATSNDGKNYSEFTDDFDSLENSSMLRVKITLGREEGKESPILYNFRVIYKPEGVEDIHYSYVDLNNKEIQEIKNEGLISNFTNSRIIKPNFTIASSKTNVSYNVNSNNSVSVCKEESGILTREVDLGGIYAMEKIFSSSNSSGNTYYQTSVDGVKWSESSAFPRYLPSGRYVRIINEIDGKQEVVLHSPIIQTTNPANETIIQEQVLDIKIIPTSDNKKEWEEIDTFTVFQDASEIVKWLDIEVIATIPVDTRIVYKFHTSEDGINWSNPVNEISKVDNSRFLKVDIVSEKKINSQTEEKPDIVEVIIDYERLNGEKQQKTFTNEPPVAVISPSPASDFISNSNIQWSFSNSTDPNALPIVEAEWRLDGELVFSMPSSLDIGEHTVELRVKNQVGKWSDWTSRTFHVVDKYGLKFNGKNTYIRVPYRSNYKVQQFTVEMLIKVDGPNPTGDSKHINLFTNGGMRVGIIRAYYTNEYDFLSIGKIHSKGSMATIPQIPKISNNEYMHITYIFDGEKLGSFLNGKSLGHSASSVPIYYEANKNIVIGANVDVNDRFF